MSTRKGGPDRMTNISGFRIGKEKICDHKRIGKSQFGGEYCLDCLEGKKREDENRITNFRKSR